MLDVSLRAGVLSLLDRMTDEFGLSVVYISHDLSLLRHMCDRLAIMYMGKIVEKGPTDQVIENPQHPYTQALINAVPVPDPGVGRERVELQGEVGDVIDIPTGCRFKARCPKYIGDVCDKVTPPLEQKSDVEESRTSPATSTRVRRGTTPTPRLTRRNATTPSRRSRRRTKSFSPRRFGVHRPKHTGRTPSWPVQSGDRPM